MVHEDTGKKSLDKWVAHLSSISWIFLALAESAGEHLALSFKMASSEVGSSRERECCAIGSCCRSHSATRSARARAPSHRDSDRISVMPPTTSMRSRVLHLTDKSTCVMTGFARENELPALQLLFLSWSFGLEDIVN